MYIGIQSRELIPYRVAWSKVIFINKLTPHNFETFKGSKHEIFDLRVAKL